MKKLLAAICMVVLASPAFAAVQNVKVSGTITSAFVDRNDFDFKVSNETTNFNQNFFYTSTHVLISSDLSDNVSAQVGLVNEMPWGDSNVSNSNSGGPTKTAYNDQTVDLELANLTLREFLYSPLTLTIGRQSLSYGNDFLVGAGGNPTSAGDLANIASDISRTLNYDGIRAVLDYKPLTIDMVFVKLNSNDLTSGVGNGIGKDDTNLYGAVANYQLGDAMNTVVEGAFWARSMDSSNAGHTGIKGDSLYVPDLRVSTNPIKDLNVGLETAMQFGNVAASSSPQVGQPRSKAWAMQARASYNLPVMEKYKPMVSGIYSYYSGDNGKNGKNSAWDPMYNDQDLGTRIWRSLFSYTNLQMMELSFSASPLEDVTAKITWSDLWQAAPTGHASSYTQTFPDGTSATWATKGKSGLGNEVDAELSYAYTEDVTFGLNLGFFKPGSAFASGNNSTAKEAIASVGVAF